MSRPSRTPPAGAVPPPLLVLLYGSSHWKEIVNFQALVRDGMISQEDLSLFRYVDSPAEALGVLQSGLAAEGEVETPALARAITSDGGAPDAPPEKRIAPTS